MIAGLLDQEEYRNQLLGGTGTIPPSRSLYRLQMEPERDHPIFDPKRSETGTRNNIGLENSCY